jgi:hypothetical protein
MQFGLSPELISTLQQLADDEDREHAPAGSFLNNIYTAAIA